MDQDANWYGGTPRPKLHCIRWGPSSPISKMGTEPRPIFGPCLLRPNSCINQDTTRYGGRPWPRPHCARRGSSSPLQKGCTTPKFSAHVYCAQTAGWIKMPLGTKVGLGPGRIVLYGDPALPPPKRGKPANFRPMFIVAKRSPISATAEHLFFDSVYRCGLG